MSSSLQQLLLKYWGYSSFRPLQEEIINSVLEGNDTLALLPTGGGKSLCFQIPALAREGMCLVISPLIALMKDQVDHLARKGIRAAAIYSGMHPDEISIVLDNCRHGSIKLLYVSPERLTMELMRESLKRMNVNLLAVDEAHCVSQWGYDFRPPYLEIANIRPLIPGAPLLALTATATKIVVKDIQQKLEFKKENLFRQSFERKYLIYMVIREEDKRNRLLRILRKVTGPGIIYVRNRRETKEVAGFLQKNGISADFYHAGLDAKTRERRQNSWVKEEKKIIVATNAFGMGIDKSNVRSVIHLDLPESIEAYFQEAGRAGRDEKEAFAVLLYEAGDIIDARHNLTLAFPELSLIRSVYQALGNYFQVPVGGGKELQFDFDLSAFADQYNFQQVSVYNSLKFLEKEGFLMLTDAFHNPSKVFIKANKEVLYKFQVENERYDHFIKTLLRSYSGILSDFVKFSEPELARRTELTVEKVVSNLRHLEKLQLLDYIRQTDNPQLIFLQERLNTKDIFLAPEHYQHRLKDVTTRLESIIRYAENGHKCRSQSLLAYFGEKETRRCGRCDVCIERNKVSLNELEFNNMVAVIKPMLKSRACTLRELVESVPMADEEKVLRVIQWLLDNDKVRPDENLNYRWVV